MVFFRVKGFEPATLSRMGVVLMRKMRKVFFFGFACLLMLVFISSVTLHGASAAYVPRTTEPADDNRYYLNTSAGGLNECLLGNGSSFSALPNCVGYAWGRAYEITGKKPTLSLSDAKNWYDHRVDGYARGAAPAIGAVMCWTDSGSGFGHVAVVEEINSGGYIRYSQSFWSGANFNYTDWVSAPIAGTVTTFSNGIERTFQGYIYILNDATQEPEAASVTARLRIEGPFRDVFPEDRFYDAVMFAYEKGLMTGMDSALFAPDKLLTREQAVTIIARLSNGDYIGYAGQPSYDDVDVKRWSAAAIAWAKATGVIYGQGDNRFDPAGLVTYDQFEAMLMRHYKLSGQGKRQTSAVTRADAAFLLYSYATQ